ncbi:NAD(P)-dependent oxidoreductase [Roseomonas sp. BN140053]|uniref:NAD(P)-dependent oxidoreductase n=1 Tax=Roseomonas sp. BN140053 TaxID=3391898 RepID=UPI0039E81ADA
MAERMLQFVRLEQRQPDKRDAEQRRQDFADIYNRFDPARASQQASRCSQCGVPFCQIHCPVNHNIPDWLKLTAENRLEEAYEVAAANNTFPEVCGRICPQDRLCEGNCVIEAGFDSVTIGAVEKYITDTAWERGWVKPPTPAREVDRSIGIIGAGPAGMAAGERLRRRGWQVTIYDRHDRAGGLLIYGIPSFKLEKDIVLRRRQQFEEGGIRFEMGVEIGRDLSFADLRARHDAVLVATGVYRARDVEVPGNELNGVVPALDFLIASNRKGLGDEVPEFDSGAMNAAGKHVVVVGGGDTAMDCVRTSVRQGAASVTCLYRRDKNNMPGSMREVKNAEEEGVHFAWLSAPDAFEGENGAVTGVRAVRMHLGLPDATGRQQVERVPGSEHVARADLVIKALGFDPEDLPGLFGEPALGVTRWGTLKVDHRTMMTNLPGVFAAGDIVRGASLVVWGIRDGRDAADRIERWVEAREALPAAAE